MNIIMREANNRTILQTLEENTNNKESNKIDEKPNFLHLMTLNYVYVPSWLNFKAKSFPN